MRFGILASICLLAARAAGPAGEDAYSEGMRALATRDWDKSLSLLENALDSDPDNIRYGSDYRQAALRRAQSVHPKEGKPADFDRPLKFFEELVAKSPRAANAHLNYGFAVVDKIPAAGSITQVILANTALDHFSKSLDLRPSWIGYYTRGVSYLFWPKIFGRAKYGVADLEKALRMQQSGSRKPFYVRTWIALGDGYWKIDDLVKARATWTKGLHQFPDCRLLKDRLAKQGDELKEMIDDALDPNKRVDTNLKELWENP